MHVIALISQKGGVGKSSLAGHIAVEASVRVTDPLLSLTLIHRAACRPGGMFAKPKRRYSCAAT